MPNAPLRKLHQDFTEMDALLHQPQGLMHGVQTEHATNLRCSEHYEVCEQILDIRDTHLNDDEDATG